MEVTSASATYERLASEELQLASAADTEQARIGHLNRASVYAYIDENLRLDPAQGSQPAALVARLCCVLEDADRLDLSEAAIHINAAIMALGGPGTVAPQAS